MASFHARVPHMIHSVRARCEARITRGRSGCRSGCLSLLSFPWYLPRGISPLHPLSTALAFILVPPSPSRVPSLSSSLLQSLDRQYGMYTRFENTHMIVVGKAVGLLSPLPLILVRAFLRRRNAPLPSVRLQDLDDDVLVRICSDIPWWDWSTVAIQCTSLLSACKEVRSASPPYLTFQTKGCPEEAKKWRTLAIASETRLKWAVDEMGYSVTLDTLREAAFRGRDDMIGHLRRHYPNQTWDMLGAYGVFRHAGASGSTEVVEWMLRQMETGLGAYPWGAPQEHEVARRECALFEGMVTYDQVQSLSVFFTPEHHMLHVLDLVDACILASSEQCLAVFLHPHMEDWWEDAEDLKRHFALAIRMGRPTMLRLLHTRFVQMIDDEWIRAVANRNLFHHVIDKAECEWDERKWYPDDLTLVDHAGVLRYMVEEMGVDIPLSRIPRAIRQGTPDVLLYIHETLHPMSVWPTSAWGQFRALTSHRRVTPLNRSAASLIAAPVPPSLIPTVIRLMSVGGIGEETCKSALECLRAMGAPWTEQCTAAAVSVACLSLLKWMMEDGAPIDRDTILDSSTELLDPQNSSRTSVSEFMLTVAYLRSVVKAPWTTSCVRLAARHVDIVPCRDGREHADYDLLRWMVMDMQAPIDDPLLSRTLVRKVTLRARK